MCHPHQRDSLERLCRYIARPALSNERLSVNEPAQVVYRLKHPFHDGSTHVVLDPLDFMRHILLVAALTKSNKKLQGHPGCVGCE